MLDIVLTTKALADAGVTVSEHTDQRYLHLPAVYVAETAGYQTDYCETPAAALLQLFQLLSSALLAADEPEPAQVTRFMREALDDVTLCYRCGDQDTTAASGLCGSCAHQVYVDEHS